MVPCKRFLKNPHLVTCDSWENEGLLDAHLVRSSRLEDIESSEKNLKYQSLVICP